MKKFYVILLLLVAAVFANAATTQVAPGDKTLSTAVAAASAGDVLVLSTGEYTEGEAYTYDKAGIVVMAAKDAKPVIKAGSHMYINATTTFLNLVFDGHGVGDYTAYINDSAAINLVFDGCEIMNYVKYNINGSDSRSHADSVIIRNCFFHDNARSVIYTYASKLGNNVPMVNYLSMTNTTVANVGSYSGVAAIDIRNNSSDVTGSGTELYVDHVTLYNFATASNGGIMSYKSPKATIKNTIIANPDGLTGLNATYLYGGTVSHSLFNNVQQHSGPAFKDTIIADPMFASPTTLDFALRNGSRAIGAADDGSNLGDTRWVLSTDPSFHMTAPAADLSTFEETYRLAWSVNDPQGGAKVTLEYSTDGTNWTVIAKDIEATTGGYDWEIGKLATATYTIRGTITFADKTSISDVAAGKLTKTIDTTVHANYYVSTTGSDSNNGTSWDAAKSTISAALSAAAQGDTVFIAAGTYNMYFSIKDGIHVFGSYDPKTGVQDINATPTILDGTDLNKYLVVKYDEACTKPTYIKGLILQNTDHSSDGGAGYLRANCFVDNCIIRNCKTSKAAGGFYSAGATITNCIFELCYADGAGGAVDMKGGIMENCIIRGCQGKYAAVRNRDGGIVRNCLFHNNQPSVEEWPSSGGIYNPSGTVYNCTFACNYGTMYAGSHSDNIMYNCVMWNNPAEDGFAEPSTYVSGSSTSLGSGDNAGDSFFESQNFTITLASNNMDAQGPQFVAPTSFVGAPKTTAQIAAMRAADFSLLSTSPLIDKGRAKGAPEADIEGTARPKGSGIDLGAYEFDPNAPAIAVTGIALNTDTLRIHEEGEDAFAVIFTPAKATNRKITWETSNKAVATVDENGVVKGISIGTAIITATAKDGGFKATGVVVVDEKPVVIIHPQVLLADSLYKIENYTVPSFIPFWVAKEAARADSTEANLKAMEQMATTLVGKEEPYCLVANINGDPATRMAFCWFTNEGVNKGQVQLVAKANATAADFTSDAKVVEADATTTKPLNYAVSTSGLLKATGMDKKTKFTYVSHKAIAENLTPGTTYSYRVGYEGHWSDIAQFTTKAAEQGEYSFIYMTDSHIQDAEYVENARICAEAAAKNAGDARFCVFPGDFVETGTLSNSEWEWERWFEESLRPVIMKMPIVPTDGNHDDSENLNYNYHFNTDNQFNITAKVKPQFDGITYSFVYGDVLFLVYSKQDYWRGSYSYSALTSTYLTKDVGNWFREQVAQHPEAKYRVALVHKNVFSGSGHQEDEETPLFRAAMLPIFKECEIDLALQGHDHCYEVIGPVNPDTRTAITSAISDVQTVDINTNTNMTGKSGGTFCTDDGTLYFIGATCGRKRYYPYTRAEMEKNFEKTKVENYFDLFTGMFGQPGAPSFTKVTVTADGLVINSYKTEKGGVATLFNTMKVVRTKEHTVPAGFEEIKTSTTNFDNVTKLIINGQLYIIRDGVTYNAVGQRIK